MVKKDTPPVIRANTRTPECIEIIRNIKNKEEGEEVEEIETVTVSRHNRSDSLTPPSSFMVLMVQLYIFIGGLAYFDPQLGFLIFLAVNVLANLCVMSGLNE